MGINEYLLSKAAAIADDENLPWDAFSGATMLVTGSTGLIGSQIVRSIQQRNVGHGSGIRLILPIRNITKAEKMFGTCNDVSYFEWELAKSLDHVDAADFVIHAASETASWSFVHEPANVITSTVRGAMNVLDYSLRSDAKRSVFVSSMEVYGEASGKVTEADIGYLDPVAARSSYPESKRLIECLYHAYFAQYGLSTGMARLAQSFGEGVSNQDNRAFAEFTRLAMNGKDIVLFSDGKKANPRISVDDAVRAILWITASGAAGEAYNAANEDTYSSAREMAECVMEWYGLNDNEVRCEYDSERSALYPRSNDMQLDTTKLEALGWKPNDGLKDMFDAMISGWNSIN